jgi:hypothetical protein
MKNKEYYFEWEKPSKYKWKTKEMSNINETNIFIFRLTKNDKPIDGHHYSI